MHADQLFDRFVALLNDSETRDAGLCGLAYLGDPRAFDLLVRHDASAEDFATLGDPRGFDVLEARLREWIDRVRREGLPKDSRGEDRWRCDNFSLADRNLYDSLESLNVSRACELYQDLRSELAELVWDLDLRLLCLGDQIAGARLVEAFKHDDNGTRRNTVFKQLVRSNVASVEDSLIAWLPEETHIEVLAAAAEVLGSRLPEACAHRLFKHWNAKAAESRDLSSGFYLRHLPSETVVEALLDYVRDESWKGTAPRVQGAHLAHRSADDLLEWLARERNRNVQVAICTALGLIGDVRAVGPLIELMRQQPADYHDGVVEAILMALGQIGGEQATDALLAVLNGPKVPSGTIFHAIAKLGSPRAIDGLLDRLSQIDEHWQRWGLKSQMTILRTLAQCYRNLPTDELERRFDSLTKDWHREVVADARIHHGGKNLPTVLAHWLTILPPDYHAWRIAHDWGYVLEYSVLEASGEHGDARCVEPLLTILLAFVDEKLDGTWVRTCDVAEALGKIGRRMREAQIAAVGVA